MNTRFFRTVSLLVILVLALSACGGKTTTTNSQPLRVGWSLWPGWYPLIIAREKGFFQKHGANINLVYFDKYGDITPALASGMLDGGGLALGDTLLDDLAEDIKVVLITDASDGADQIVASPDIKSVEDLRGKRIGFEGGTYAEVLVQEMLDKNGIPRSEVTMVEVPVEEIPNAIPKLIDAGHTFEPYASQARGRGFKPIFTSADVPGLLLDVFSFRKDVIQQRPQDVKGFIAAWYEALEYWQTHQVEGNTIIANALGISPSEVTLEGIKVYGQAENLKAFQASNDTTSIYYPARLEIKFLSDRGIISYPVKIDTNFLDPSFLQ